MADCYNHPCESGEDQCNPTIAHYMVTKDHKAMWPIDFLLQHLIFNIIDVQKHRDKRRSHIAYSQFLCKSLMILDTLQKLSISPSCYYSCFSALEEIIH